MAKKVPIIVQTADVQDSGVIHDSRVFRLGLVEERIKRITAEQELFKLKVDMQLKAFIEARDKELLVFKVKLDDLQLQDIKVRSDIAQAHGIDFNDWAWDDEVGVLNRIGISKT